MEILEELIYLGCTLTIQRTPLGTILIIERHGRAVEGQGMNIRRAAIHALMQLADGSLFASEAHADLE